MVNLKAIFKLLKLPALVPTSCPRERDGVMVPFSVTFHWKHVLAYHVEYTWYFRNCSAYSLKPPQQLRQILIRSMPFFSRRFECLCVLPGRYSETPPFFSPGAPTLTPISGLSAVTWLHTVTWHNDALLIDRVRLKMIRSFQRKTT